MKVWQREREKERKREEVGEGADKKGVFKEKRESKVEWREMLVFSIYFGRGRMGKALTRAEGGK